MEPGLARGLPGGEAVVPRVDVSLNGVGVVHAMGMLRGVRISTRAPMFHVKRLVPVRSEMDGSPQVR